MVKNRNPVFWMQNKIRMITLATFLFNKQKSFPEARERNKKHPKRKGRSKLITADSMIL
jgi:hypothetical protein